MIFESSNWRVTRRIGIGDLQHVRSNLLSVGCFSQRHLQLAVEGSYRAGVELGMTPIRVHINAGREHPVVWQHLINTALRFLTHDAQLMEHGSFITRETFNAIFESCDLLVEPLGEPNVNVDDYLDELVELMKTAWTACGGRFLRGNFAAETLDDLRRRYPSFCPDSDPFYWNYTCKS